MWNARWLWIQWRRKVLHHELIWVLQSILHFEGTSVFFSCCDRVLGDSLQFHHGNRGSLCLWLGSWTSSAWNAGNRASSCSDGEVSWVFSSCGSHLVYILEFRRGWPFEPRVCSAMSGLLSSYDGHIRNLNYPWQENTDTSGVSREAKRPLLVGRVILVFLSIFTKSQASSPFEALNSAHLSKSQIDVRPSVQKRLRTMAFSRVSTRDSDFPSSCEMKDEPAFKPL